VFNQEFKHIQKRSSKASWRIALRDSRQIMNQSTTFASNTKLDAYPSTTGSLPTANCKLLGRDGVHACTLGDRQDTERVKPQVNPVKNSAPSSTMNAANLSMQDME
jgi:hypothetical protein